MVECPPNFGMVASDLYRSSFPRAEHFSFLERLHLKSILVLLPEPYPAENAAFCERNGIKLFQIPLSGNKEPFVYVDPKTIAKALKIVNDKSNYPLLIHCNQGKHRTGCVVGCFRRMQRWSLSLIFEEYRRYAFPKVRPLDQLMIESFSPESGFADKEELLEQLEEMCGRPDDESENDAHQTDDQADRIVELPPDSEDVSSKDPKDPKDPKDSKDSKQDPLKSPGANLKLLKDTPVKDTPVKDTPVKNTPLKDTPLKDTPLKDAPLKETPYSPQPNLPPLETAPNKQTKPASASGDADKKYTDWQVSLWN